MTITIYYDDDKIKTFRYVHKIEQYNNCIILYVGYRVIIPLTHINNISICI